MARVAIKEYAVADLFNGNAHENGNTLFWLGRMAGIDAVLEKDFVSSASLRASMPISSVAGIFSGITCVKEGDRLHYRLSIGNEIVIAPVESRMSIFSVA